MDIQLQKLKAFLPIEITAAYFAAKQIVDGARLDEAGQPIAQGENFEIMAIVLVFLLILNAYALASSRAPIYMILFSSLLFIVWAVNIDIVRWEDALNGYLGLSPSGTNVRVIFGILAVLLSVSATFFSIPAIGNRLEGKNGNERNEQ